MLSFNVTFFPALGRNLDPVLNCHHQQLGHRAAFFSSTSDAASRLLIRGVFLISAAESPSGRRADASGLFVRVCVCWVEGRGGEGIIGVQCIVGNVVLEVTPTVLLPFCRVTLCILCCEAFCFCSGFSILPPPARLHPLPSLCGSGVDRDLWLRKHQGCRHRAGWHLDYQGFMQANKTTSVPPIANIFLFSRITSGEINSDLAKSNDWAKPLQFWIITFMRLNQYAETWIRIHLYSL